jgi:cytochrome c-type biogenesis protein CcmH/NrfG
MKASLIALICSTALALPLAVQAAGGGAGGDTAPAVQNQDPDYLAGMDAVKRKDWQQVVVNMDAYIKRKPDDADAWTQLGHAHRLTGKMDPAFDAYDKALKINPKHRGAVEYLGEAYLQMNDLPRAEQQLKVLDKLCFFPCEEYTDLKAKISDFKKGKQASSGS